jgi:hypothetical protein
MPALYHRGLAHPSCIGEYFFLSRVDASEENPARALTIGAMTVNEIAARAHAKRLARASEQRVLFFRDSVAPGHADADTWLLRRSVAHSTTFSGVPASSMASQQPKTEADTASELDAMEVERRRKQRDLKRKSRERKKVCACSRIPVL